MDLKFPFLDRYTLGHELSMGLCLLEESKNTHLKNQKNQSFSFSASDPFGASPKPVSVLKHVSIPFFSLQSSLLDLDSSTLILCHNKGLCLYLIRVK